MLTVVLQEPAAKLADLFPRLMGMLTPSRNPRQKKNVKEKQAPNLQGKHSALQNSLTEKFNRGTARKSSNNKKFGREAGEASPLPSPAPRLKVPLQAKFAEAPGSSEQMVFTHYSRPAAFPGPIRRLHSEAKRFPDSVTVFNSYSTRWMTQKMNKQGK